MPEIFPTIPSSPPSPEEEAQKRWEERKAALEKPRGAAEYVEKIVAEAKKGLPEKPAGEIPPEVIKELPEESPIPLQERVSVIHPEPTKITELKLEEKKEPPAKAELSDIIGAANILKTEKDFAAFFQGYVNWREILATEPKKVSEYRELFKTKKETEVRLINLYQKELGEALKVPMTAEGKAAIDAYLSKEARENPEKLSDRLDELKEYETYQNKIKTLDQEIQQLGGEEARQKAIAELKREADIIKWTKGWRGFINPKNSELLGWFFRWTARETKEETGFRKQLLAQAPGFLGFRLQFFRNYEPLLKQKMDELMKIESVPERRAYFKTYINQMRKDFFKNLLIAENLKNMMIKEALNQLGRLFSAGELEKLAEAQQYYARLKETGELYDLEILKNLNDEEFNKEIEKRTQAIIANLFSEKISSVKIENKPAEEIQKIPEPVAAEAVQNKIKEDAEKTQTLEEKIQKLEQESSAKKKTTEKRRVGKKTSKEITALTEEIKSLKKELEAAKEDKRKNATENLMLMLAQLKAKGVKIQIGEMEAKINPQT
jgi:hypothetical protein